MQHSNEIVEEWRTIEGFENYEVSNLGRVRRVEYIKQREDFNGYPIVSLYKGGEGKTAKVHRLVAQAFIPKLSTDGTLIEEFDSTYDAQAKLGISNSNICACLKGRRKMAGGFLWRYK